MKRIDYAWIEDQLVIRLIGFEDEPIVSISDSRANTWTKLKEGVYTANPVLKSGCVTVQVSTAKHCYSLDAIHGYRWHESLEIPD